ncbi:MAG: CAP domain-containing protein [Myxococcales bacterium]|nr:CAP domain-containing protein [Myxococcales bacterium]
MPVPSSCFARPRNQRGFLGRTLGSVGLMALLVACGGASGGVTGSGQGSVAPGEAPQDTSSMQVFQGPTSPATHYRTDPTPAEGLEREAEWVRAGSADHLAEGGQELVRDGRLDRLAAFVLELVRLGRDVPPEAVEFFAHALGIPDATPHLLVVGTDDEDKRAAMVTEDVADFFSTGLYTHFGVAATGGMVVALLTERPLSIDPIPRRLSVGGTFECRGHLSPGYRDGVFAITSPQGTVETGPLGQGVDLSLRRVFSKAGVYQVEFLATGKGGPTVIFNAPLFVGVDPPMALRGAAQEEAPTEDFVGAILSQINGARRAAGLAPVRPLPNLATVARSHSEDMVRSGFVAHVSPTTGDASDRVRRAGLKYDLVIENIARAYGPRGTFEGLMKSPAHRGGILDSRVTHVGIGVAETADKDRRAYLTTLLFTRIAEALDPIEAQDQLAKDLVRLARERGAKLARHGTLDRIAQQHVKRFFGEGAPAREELVSVASGQVRGFTKVHGTLLVVSSIEEAWTVLDALPAVPLALGIGVAQGHRPDVAPNAVAVLLLFGEGG